MAGSEAMRVGGNGRKAALCGLLAALGIVILLLAGWIGIGTYIGPVLAGLLLIPIERKYGTKTALTLWAAIGLLSLFLVVDTEETLMFLAFFGWYPAIRPKLEKLAKGLRWLIKELVFNAAIAAVELLIFFVLAPEAATIGMMLILFLLFNLTFLAYDRALPGVENLVRKRLHFW